MKTIRVIYVIVILLAGSSLLPAQSNKTAHAKGATDSLKWVQYVCPMHPGEISSKPGKCARCGMDMNLSKKEQLKQSESKFCCTMHPEVVSDKAGVCPICGMGLQLSKKEQIKLATMNGFRCPMHADITSVKPGKCPKCGMALTGGKAKINKNQ